MICLEPIWPLYTKRRFLGGFLTSKIEVTIGHEKVPGADLVFSLDTLWSDPPWIRSTLAKQPLVVDGRWAKAAAKPGCWRVNWRERGASYTLYIQRKKHIYIIIYIYILYHNINMHICMNKHQKTRVRTAVLLIWILQKSRWLDRHRRLQSLLWS